MLDLNPASIDETLGFEEWDESESIRCDMEHYHNWYDTYEDEDDRLVKIDWNWNGKIDEDRQTTADILSSRLPFAAGGIKTSWIKRVIIEEPLLYGPQLVNHGGELYLFRVPEQTGIIHYDLWNELAGCDIRDLGPDGQGGQIDQHPCGWWSAEGVIDRPTGIGSEMSIVSTEDDMGHSLYLFFLNENGHLCLIKKPGVANPGYAEWSGPFCDQSHVLYGPPEAIQVGDDILILSIGEEIGPFSGDREVVSATIENFYTSWSSPSAWVWSTVLYESEDNPGTQMALSSKTTPAAIYDHMLDKLVAVGTDSFGGMFVSTQAPNAGSTWTLLDNEVRWLDRPNGAYRSRKMHSRPALAWGPKAGSTEWQLWYTKDLPGSTYQNFRRIRTSFEKAEAGEEKRHVFSIESDVTEPVVRAAEESNISLVYHNGILRAAVAYDAWDQDDPNYHTPGYIFLPLADGIFMAALRDVNDVALIGQNMGATLAPPGFELFCGMTAEELEEMEVKNNLPPGVLVDIERDCDATPQEEVVYCTGPPTP